MRAGAAAWSRRGGRVRFERRSSAGRSVFFLSVQRFYCRERAVHEHCFIGAVSKAPRTAGAAREGRQLTDIRARIVPTTEEPVLKKASLIA
ncbi:hypothetical protein EVAR_33691_1 [Eumeta japonica]|uniref:Uncharacterized protein n=1 Tax=Eumeta variegata TaxID=151549 RepID=A0A4C1VQN3_EUMVA|nr:hypothetical protein EVAR_33691_1 [Eumeta japonica]